MSTSDWEDLEGEDREEIELGEDLPDVEEEVDVLGGGGPAATWQGGELGEEESRRADTDHGEF